MHKDEGGGRPPQRDQNDDKGRIARSEKGKREEERRWGGRPGPDSKVEVETPSCQRRFSQGRDGG